MSTLILWIYGSLGIASFIMAISFGRVALTFYGRSAKELVWDKSFLVSFSLAMHSLAMTLACGYRTWDIFFRNIVSSGTEPLSLALVLAMLLCSKSILVWAAAIRDVEHEAKWPWWIYLMSTAGWGAMCAMKDGWGI